MKNNNYQPSTVKYLQTVRKYIKEKYGKFNAEWEQPLELLGDNYELYQQCRDSIQNDGLMLLARNGSYTRNPLLKVQLDAQIQISKLLTEFGLTPRAQSKINLLQDEENDPLKELLSE